MTIEQEYAEYSGMHPEKADNDRISGVSLIHEYLRFEPRPPKQIPPGGYSQEIAMKILRLNGPSKYEEYMDIFRAEEPEVNLPLLQIFEPTIHTGTKELIETIPIAQYDEKNKEDYAQFDGDDPLDMLRYMLKAVNAYIEEVLVKTRYFEREAEIIQDLNMTGDMTSYYMRMQRLEHDRKTLTPRPVRRYH
jgi:hypothetical protein